MGDESCEVIEATRVEKPIIEATRVEKAAGRTFEAPQVELGSPKTPPPLPKTPVPAEPAPGKVLEERSKRAAEDGESAEAPVSKAAKNLQTTASPIPKPRTKLGGKTALVAKESNAREDAGNDEVRKDLHAAHELCPSYSSFFVYLTFC